MARHDLVSKVHLRRRAGGSLTASQAKGQWRALQSAVCRFIGTRGKLPPSLWLRRGVEVTCRVDRRGMALYLLHCIQIYFHGHAEQSGNRIKQQILSQNAFKKGRCAAARGR
jgi:hypothetical protein